MWLPSSIIIKVAGPVTSRARRSASAAGTTRSSRPLTMKMGHVMFCAMPTSDNVLAFSLIYWAFDGGGAAARLNEPAKAYDFAFPQHLNDVGPSNWRPIYVDYLFVAFTAATAMGPADTLPLTSRAKLALGLQALSSLLVLGLVIARAVNIFN